MKWLKLLWPTGLLFLIELLLFLTNYHPGTYLAGWDGLYPELNFSANLQRNIFAVWQEYRGVGLYDGMSYASNLVHTLFLYLLHVVLPQDLLRYTFIFLMHAVGVFGMYFLLRKLLKQKIISVVGSLFYGFNLGVIQIFYAPLEVFAIHFAFLPILVWSLFSYLHHPTWKKLLLFAIFSLLATPQGFVPQIFITYLMLVGSILGVYFWTNGRDVLPSILKVLTVTFCINAFWLLPYVYGLPQNAQVIMNSKINQMASNKIYLMNKNRGNFIDVLTMKGFMLDTAEFSHQRYGYIMQDWRKYTSSPLFILPSIVFVALMLFGLFTILKTKQVGFYPFVITFGFTFFFLGNDILGLNAMNALVRWLFPIFNEAFRFPFTKFETLFAFSYTILIAYGLIELVKRVTRVGTPLERPQVTVGTRTSKRGNERQDPFAWQTFKQVIGIEPQSLIKFLFSILFLFLLLLCLPAFQGNFLFEGVRVKMEPEYQHMIDFLQTQPTSARIATLPQPTFYNWEYHENNYRGSGFLWYGIPQATLERSFDPWSNYNENYYWELSHALYSHDANALKQVFSKYQVQMVLLDENLTYPFAPKSLQIQETKDMLLQIGAKQGKQFGKVTLFTIPAPPLFAVDNLPNVNPYQWGDTDVFYQMHGNYIAQSEADFILPFRSLFTNRSQSDFPLTITETDSDIALTGTLPAQTSHITLPAFAVLESFIQGRLVYARGTRSVSLVLQTPQTLIGGQPISGENLTYSLFTLPERPAFPITVQVNDQNPVTMASENVQTLGTFLIPVAQDTFVTAEDQLKGQTTGILPKEKIQEIFSKPVSISLSSANTSFPITVKIPKSHSSFSPHVTTANVINCNSLSSDDGKIQFTKTLLNTRSQQSTLSLSALHADACLSFFDKQAQSSQGYFLSVKSKHTRGEPLSFWAEDPSQDYPFLYTQLPNDNTDTTSHFIIPPREKFNLGYSFHIENISTGNAVTQNELGNVSFSPIPYDFLTHITADTGKNPHVVTTKNVIFEHPNPSLYNVTADFSSMDTPTLVLSQAYDPGWKAYSIDHVPSTIDYVFPFFSGRELTNHVKVNNWENGWRLANNELHTINHVHVVILFLPQYLEYLGFGILGISIVILLLQNIQHIKRNRTVIAKE